MRTNLVLRHMNASDTVRHHVQEISDSIERDFFPEGREAMLSVVVDFPRKRNHSNGTNFTVRMLLKNIGQKSVIHVEKTRRNIFEALTEAAHALKNSLSKRRRNHKRFTNARIALMREWFASGPPAA